MRHLIIILLGVITATMVRGQNATPAKPAPESTPESAAFKPTGYQDPKTGEIIILTGPGTLVQQLDGRTRAGKYTVDGRKMQVVFDSDDGSGNAATLHHTYDLVDAGLQDDEFGQVLMNEAALKEKKAAESCLSNAKQIALACRLYATDNDGKFPKNLADLIPTYLQDDKLFISPLSAKKEAMGYEYFGAGGTDNDDPAKVLLRSKDTTRDGRRIIVRFDSSGTIKADK